MQLEPSDIHPMDYRKLEPDNPWYPLPSNYELLSSEAQKKARITALTRQNSPLEFVAAWDLFRRLYLMTTEPGFFYHNFTMSPPFHYEAICDLGRYARNILAAPRGFAKSVVVGTELPLFLLLTRPHIRIVLCLATDKLIEGRFDTIIKQIEQNPGILEDFGVQKSRRGAGIWNRHHIQLKNGSKMEGFSVTGRKRGARPDLFLLDDPEFDPENIHSSSEMREKFETLLFRQVIPMLEHGSAIFWIGTIIHKRSFLAHSLFGEDSRFSFWNRKVLEAWKPDPENPDKKKVLWDGKWSQRILQARKEEIGAAAFASEYLNTPQSEEDRMFTVDPLKNEYRIEQPLATEHPLDSSHKVSWHSYTKEEDKWVPQEETSGTLFSQMFRVIVVDIARGLSQHNDYSCVEVLGFDKNNCMWVLDMWMGRVKEPILLNIIYKMGLRWRVRLVGIESVALQIQVVDSMNTLLDERSDSGVGWRPRVVPIKYAGSGKPQQKAERIAALGWRFDSGKVKYPGHLKQMWPWNELYSQTEDFTYDLAMLRFDDAIDTLAMSAYVIHGKGVQGPQQPRDPSLEQRIKDGDLMVAGAVPLLSGLNANQMSGEVLDALVDRAYSRAYNSDSRNMSIKNRRNNIRIRRGRR